MLNNRKYMIGLKKELEIKEDCILNLRDDIQNLQLENQEVRVRNKNLEQVLEQKDLEICELNMKLVRLEGQLEKIRNYCMVTAEVDILGGEM